MFDIVLVPTDGSKHAAHATDVAIEMAVKFDAELVIMHVLLEHGSAQEIEHVLEGAEFGAETRLELKQLHDVSAPIPVGGSGRRTTLSPELASRVAEHVISEARQRARDAGVERLSTECLSGSPAKCIIDVAGRRRAELLVMGTRGLGALSSVFHGSVSEAVRHRCGCACLTTQ